MEKYDISQQQLINQLNLSDSEFNNILSDQSQPDKSIRNKIRLIFDGEDAFPNLDDSFEMCKKCVHNCKQLYWIAALDCKKFVSAAPK